MPKTPRMTRSLASVGRLVRRRRTEAQRPLPGAAPHVLVTGAAGLIGRIVVQDLSADHAVRGLDVKRGPNVDWVRDMTKFRQVALAFEGVSAVIDLAADASPSTTWKSVLHNNVTATVNTLECARRAGVRRVVFASSNHAVGMYERDEPYASIVAGKYEGLDPATVPRLGVDGPTHPDGPYGAGKAFGEIAARYYSEQYGISVICLRIGTVNAENRPLSARHFATLLTHRDLVHLIRCCLAAPEELLFDVFYGVSANRWRFWDIEGAREGIGYTPQDDAEAWR
jgi:nucleoside-diphosphate-sugar epimerase